MVYGCPLAPRQVRICVRSDLANDRFGVIGVDLACPRHVRLGVISEMPVVRFVG
jgi:hypothetical protein